MAEQTDDVQQTGEAEGNGAAEGVIGNDPATLDVPVTISVVLGETTMTLSKLRELSRGAVVPLDRLRGEQVDVYAQNRFVARGELQIVDEQEKRLGVKMTEIVRSRNS